MILEYTFIYSIHISPSNSILLCKALCTVHSISTQHTVGCLGAGALEQLLHSDLSELGPCTQAPLLLCCLRTWTPGGAFVQVNSKKNVRRQVFGISTFYTETFFKGRKFFKGPLL